VCPAVRGMSSHPVSLVKRVCAAESAFINSYSIIVSLICSPEVVDKIHDVTIFAVLRLRGC